MFLKNCLFYTFIILVSACVVKSYSQVSKQPEKIINEVIISLPNNTSRPEDAFVGVYTECILYLSYTCLQKKTLMYLYKLHKQKEVPILGNYLSFVKMENASTNYSHEIDLESIGDHITPSPRLSKEIDSQVENFFENHYLRVKYGNNSIEDLHIGKVLQIVEGRKNKDKGDGGGDGKKKMMMMAMMCMKMKMMMMVPAMMGMMGMMSLKAMLLATISLLISKVLLVMKLMGGSGGGKGGSGGMAHGGSDAMWMPSGGGGGGGGWNAGGHDSYASSGGSSGGGGGYNSNAEWQSRSGREILRIPILNPSRENQQVLNRRKRQSPLEEFYFQKQDLNKINVRPKRWLFSADDDAEMDKKKTHKKKVHSKGKKKKGPKKHKKIESMSEYMDGMKHAVEDNVWD